MLVRRVWDITRRAGHHIGRRGVFLLFLALLDLVVGYSLTAPTSLSLSAREVYRPFVDVMPLVAWTVAWLGVGAACVVAAVWQRTRPAVFFLAALLKTGWAMGYFIGWLSGDALFVRGYLSGAIFLMFALVAMTVSGWRENGR